MIQNSKLQNKKWLKMKCMGLSSLNSKLKPTKLPSTNY